MRNAFAQAASVAPVVQTSSTRRAVPGAAATARTVGGSASRCRRLRPTCRRPRSLRRHFRSGIPDRSATAIASSSAGSKPRQRHLNAPAGTGTTASGSSFTGSEASSLGGRACSIASAATPARASRRPNFSPWTSCRATPSNGDAETARSTPDGPASRTRGATASSFRQRSQSVRSPCGVVPQAGQIGGATSETSCRSSSAL